MNWKYTDTTKRVASRTINDQVESSLVSILPEGTTIDPCDPIPGEMLAYKIRSSYADLMKMIVTPYLPEERETWYIQVQEAYKWLVDNNATVPMITSIAQARGVSVEYLVNSIRENDTNFRVAVGNLLGMQQKELDSLKVV